MGFHKRHGVSLAGRGLLLLSLLGVLLPALLLGYLLHTKWLKPLTILEQIRHDGRLVAITNRSPTTYFDAANGPAGLEYDLVTAFAAELGVSAEFVFSSDDAEITARLRHGDAHLAATGSAPPATAARLNHGPVYQQVTPQLIYRSGEVRPTSLDQLAQGILEVPAGSAEDVLLQQLQQSAQPDLEWTASEGTDFKQLMYLLDVEMVDYTIANSNLFAFERRFYPKMRIAFDLDAPLPLQWLSSKTKDDSLNREINRFFEKIRANGDLQRSIDRYYAIPDQMTIAQSLTFWSFVGNRLPIYEELFQEIAGQHDYDWRLLAAIAYQESHLNPDAVSPTGVKGLMMLTEDTAELFDVTDREDPEQSIQGAVRFLQFLERRIPEEIGMPDRLSFILASYNVGLGHIFDARRMTKVLGGDDDKWLDVRRYLPLLTEERFYSKLKHGQARGHEPVIYVDNIHNYYHLLVWHTNFRSKVSDTSLASTQ
ncbi:MAG: membrane-bound lytic murein transglycosylase MltF [Pseudomonadota bacterium]